jgi:predicted enzyme related to lactoylglutathione lyase
MSEIGKYPPNSPNLRFVTLRTNNIEVLDDFYGKVMGMRAISGAGTEARCFKDFSIELRLEVDNDEGLPMVIDMASAVANQIATKVKCIGVVVVGPENSGFFGFTDPDGNLIRLFLA